VEKPTPNKVDEVAGSETLDDALGFKEQPFSEGKRGIEASKDLGAGAVHGNSLKSLRPTWGYKFYSADGTFLKNGITSKLIPEKRYTRKFMSDKYMETILFPNRLDAYQWEYQQNQILPGPLNFNMH